MAFLTDGDPNHPYTKTDYDLMILAAESMHPDLFRRLNPRTYPEISGYYSTKVLASSLMDMIAMMDAAASNPDHAPNSARLIVPALGYHIQRRMPIMFLAQSFVDALKLTDFKEDLDWTTMPLPYEHGILALPKNSLVHPVDGDCAFIMFSRYREGVENWPPSTVGVNRPIAMADDSFCVCGMFPSAGLWYDTCITKRSKPVIRIRNVFEGGEGKQAFPLTTQFDTDLETDADLDMAAKLAALTFGTILALTARPDLLTPATHTNTIFNKKSGKRTEFWSPNIVGKHYSPRKAPTGEPGTHQSPRMHWRRGHFRNQHYGPARSQIKMIWLEPQLVNSE